MSREYFVKVGDVIKMTPGMCVGYDRIPEFFYTYSHGIFDEGLVSGHLHLDDRKVRRTNAEKERALFRESIRHLFRNNGAPFSPKAVWDFVAQQLPDPEPFELCVPSGLYEVLRVEKRTDEIGVEVFCRTYQPAEGQPSYDISFYQGANMLENHNWVELVNP